jgi:hypothetical protein
VATELPSIVAEQTKRAKARFSTMDDARLGAFIASQPDVRGEVNLIQVRYLAEGAGQSNGIAFVTALLDRGHGLQTEEFVLRYSPGVSLFKQKCFQDEFLTLRAAHRRGLPVPRVYGSMPKARRSACPPTSWSGYKATLHPQRYFHKGRSQMRRRPHESL